MQKSLLVVLMLAGMLAACSSVPMLTDADLLARQQAGELQPFYEQLQDELKLAKPGSDFAENRQLYLEKTGRVIAEQKEQAILDGLGRGFEKHSIATLNEALDKAAGIRAFSVPVYDGLRSQLEQAMSQKKGVILAKEAEYEDHTDRDAVQKVALLDEITAIYGDGPDADRIRAQRSAYLAGLLQGAQAAMKDKRYKDAAALVDSLEKIDPAYAGIAEIRRQLLAAEYEQQFWDALEKGETDRAYATFHKLTVLPDYVQTHPDVVPIAEDMAQFFIAEGDQWMKDKAVDMAYQSYSRARYIRNVINAGDLYSPGEKKFIEAVIARFEGYNSRSLPVPAYGALLVVEEFMPEHPLVVQHARSLQESVLAEASVKVIGKDFSGNNESGEYGMTLLAGVGDRLVSRLPGRIRWIDGKAAAEHYGPVQIVAMPNPSSYLVLGGEMLEAGVSRKEELQPETLHVLTGYASEANPAYVEWQALGKRQQKEVPQPPATIEKPVEQDITVNKTIIEQAASLAVSYRLAEAVSARVLFSDTAREKQSYRYEDTPRIEAGLYVAEARKDEIRADAEVMQDLSARLAEAVTVSLVRRIEKLQQEYVKTADQAVVLENFNEAAIHYAYAYALSRTVETADADLLARFRTYALRWQ